MKRLAIFLVLACVLAGNAGAASPAKKKKMCVSPANAAKFLEAQAPRGRRLRQMSDSLTFTSGNVVVLQADPQILIVPNSFDLKRNAVRFIPTPHNRYIYSLIPYSFNAGASDALTLKDDDFVQLDFKNFIFPFAGKFYTSCFVNSNGNITFDAGDTEPPNMDTLMDGPPRIAPFFADLDPEASGTVFVQQTPDVVVVSWLKVPEFYNQNQFDYGQNTFQVVLYKDGRIDLIYASEISATEALIGILPGYGKAQMRLVDFTRGTLKGRPAGALLENFHSYESIDFPSTMKALYRNYGDKYDFVTLLSNFDLNPVPGAQAFAIVVQNDAKGIGNPAGRGSAIFRDTARYGSAGRLQNITFFGNIHQYPSDPNRELPDTYTSALQMLAHEVAHRWLAYVKLTQDGASADLLLGRDQSHWSFFYNSEGSYLEGNQILQKSRSSFVTSHPFTRYSTLDLYLMGLISPSEVKSSFVVLGGSNFSPSFEFAPESAPEPDVAFRGSARTFTISDIIAANGERIPDSSTSQKTFTHLFVLITKKDNPASAADIGAVEQLRSAWEGYFAAATAGKGTVQTNVQ